MFPNCSKIVVDKFWNAQPGAGSEKSRICCVFQTWDCSKLGHSLPNAKSKYLTIHKGLELRTDRFWKPQTWCIWCVNRIWGWWNLNPVQTQISQFMNDPSLEHSPNFVFSRFLTSTHSAEWYYVWKHQISWLVSCGKPKKGEPKSPPKPKFCSFSREMFVKCSQIAQQSL